MAILAVVFFATTVNAQSKDQAAVKTVVQNYFGALNASDVNKVASYFITDGVLLAPGAPTATGTDQLKGTFKYVFDNFTYILAVAIADVTVEGDYAFVASTSNGSFVIKSSNQKIEDDFRETFILKRVNGQWKIARYMYNKSK
ncbi:SgcJ/EcaC family oxidoreductase [Pedobacter psychroterrae]|uniref:SgcJ/EcaC family oxidoreductase n=2 Tax=Pedobacter psychroterrae TaxID=2530453 RepID=A0A4R0NGD6_9SPHI|nr:SgcJ/EcaC family oxidoreductase [Pedobacter psychroterrae]